MRCYLFGLLSLYLFAVPCLPEWAAQPAQENNILILGRIACDPFPCYLFPAEPAGQSHVIFLFRLGQLADVVLYFLFGRIRLAWAVLSFFFGPTKKGI